MKSLSDELQGAINANFVLIIFNVFMIELSFVFSLSSSVANIINVLHLYLESYNCQYCSQYNAIGVIYNRRAFVCEWPLMRSSSSFFWLEPITVWYRTLIGFFGQSACLMLINHKNDLMPIPLSLLFFFRTQLSIHVRIHICTNTPINMYTIFYTTNR